MKIHLYNLSFDELAVGHHTGRHCTWRGYLYGKFFLQKNDFDLPSANEICAPKGYNYFKDGEIEFAGKAREQNAQKKST